MKNPSSLSIPFTNRLIILLLALFVTVAFHNCLQNDFIGDDKALFLDNQFYKSLSHFPKIFSRELVMSPTAFDASQKATSFSGCISYRPVSAATFFIDYALWKTNPLGHHLSNIVLHFLVTVLVFYFILRISGSSIIAFWAATIFAVHPIQSEVVNASGYRSDILMTLFYLGGILAYFRYNEAKKKVGWLCVVAAAYFLALFSKESALTFSIVIFLIDRFFMHRQSLREFFYEMKGLYLVLAGITVFYLYIYFVRIPNTFYLQAAPQALTGLAKIVLMLKIFAQYVTVLVIPSQISILPPMYTPPVFPLHAWELVVPLYVVLCSVLLGKYYFRQNKLVAFGFLWFFLNYIPTSGVIPLLNPIAYRFLYLPSIGFFLIAALLVRSLIVWLESKNFVLNISFLSQSALIGLLIALTIANNTFFKNDFVACQEMVRRYPECSRPYWILGLDYYLAGNRAEAVKYLQKHLQAPLNNPFISSDKEKFLTYHLLGKAIADPDAAIGYLKKAASLAPGFAEVFLDLSKNYIAKKDLPTAMAYAQHAANLDPQLASASVYMVYINIEEGKLTEARTLMSIAREKFKGDVNVQAVEKYLQNKEKEK